MARLDGNQDMVFNDYIEIYYSDREAHLKLNTFLTKKNIIEKNIRPYYAGYKLVEITPAIVMKWQNEIINYFDISINVSYISFFKFKKL